MLLGRPDPRTALAYGVAASASALTGPLPAGGVLVLSALLAWATRTSWRRLLPLVGSFGLLLVLLPLSPGPFARVIVKGLAVSFTVVVAVSAARWDRLVAALQGFGLGRAPVAFVSIVLSHLEDAGRDAAGAVDALRLRGGFRGLRGLGRSTPLLLARTLRRAFERADRTADALALRGFSGRLPPLPRYRPGRADLLPAAASLAALVAAFGSLAWNR